VRRLVGAFFGRLVASVPDPAKKVQCFRRRMTDSSHVIGSALVAARQAQVRWAATPLDARLLVLRRARHLIATRGMHLAEASAQCRQRPAAEALTAEVLPLAGACRFLEREAARLLAPRRLHRWTRPLWLTGVGAEVRHEPFGVVLVIGPGNYPLLLPGVQLLQALAAGNGVLLKPAPGSSAPVRVLLELLVQAGLDSALVAILPDSVEASQSALTAGVDKVVFTGSAVTGEKILAQLAPQLVPATMELSGCDAVFVRADADLDLVGRCLVFGLQLNAGATCLGPRRAFVHHSVFADLERRLAQWLAPGPAKNRPGPKAGPSRAKPLIDDALSRGARVVTGRVPSDGALEGPIILAGVPPDAGLLREDVFAPVLSLIPVQHDEEALALDAPCPYALGATIFSRDEAEARVLASRLRAGSVGINDMIAPTADPRLPFGGRRRSGFGVTRGAEGLLEMTTPKVITWNRARWRPHLDDAMMADATLFQAFLEFSYGSWRDRGPALLRLLKRARHSLRASRRKS